MLAFARQIFNLGIFIDCQKVASTLRTRIPDKSTRIQYITPSGIIWYFLHISNIKQTYVWLIIYYLYCLLHSIPRNHLFFWKITFFTKTDNFRYCMMHVPLMQVIICCLNINNLSCYLINFYNSKVLFLFREVAVHYFWIWFFQQL